MISKVLRESSMVSTGGRFHIFASKTVGFDRFDKLIEQFSGTEMRHLSVIHKSLVFC